MAVLVLVVLMLPPGHSLFPSPLPLSVDVAEDLQPKPIKDLFGLGNGNYCVLFSHVSIFSS